MSLNVLADLVCSLYSCKQVVGSVLSHDVDNFNLKPVFASSSSEYCEN